MPDYRPDPKTAREVLNIIDRFLDSQEGRPQGRKLWNILTALRGPDSDVTDLKLQTTAPIRAAAFPQTALRVLRPLNGVGIAYGAYFGGRLRRFGHDWDHAEAHFKSHVRRAAEALPSIPEEEQRS